MKKWLILLSFLCISCRAGTQVCFTPGQDCEGLFVATINKAQHTLDIQEYHLTSKAIVRAVLRAKERGVGIRIILDKTAKKEATPFLTAGISVNIDYRVRIAHNKVMIVDNAIVIGGSYNPTESAQRKNAENLIIEDQSNIVDSFAKNFLSRLKLSSILQ